MPPGSVSDISERHLPGLAAAGEGHPQLGLGSRRDGLGAGHASECVEKIPAECTGWIKHTFNPSSA